MWMVVTGQVAVCLLLLQSNGQDEPGYLIGSKQTSKNDSLVSLPAELRQRLHHRFIAGLVKEGHRHTRCAGSCVEDAV